MILEEFSRINRLRSESPDGFGHKLNDWSLSDWFTAVVGELGEAANVAKKLNRVRDGIGGNKETADQLRAKLASELADTFIYLDLLAQSCGIDLGEAVVRTFNAKSDQLGCPIKFDPAQDRAGADLALAVLVKRMRDAQRTYFRTRSTAALEDSKQLEREVDRAVAGFDRQPSLFGPDLGGEG